MGVGGFQITPPPLGQFVTVNSLVVRGLNIFWPSGWALIRGWALIDFFGLQGAYSNIDGMSV